MFYFNNYKNEQDCYLNKSKQLFHELIQNTEKLDFQHRYKLQEDILFDLLIKQANNQSKNRII